MIGRNYKIGVGKESSRGTAVTPTAWIPATDTPYVKETKDYVSDDAGYGIITGESDAVITKEYSQGEIKANVQDQSIGYFLLAALGSVVSTVKETTAYQHVFSLLNSNSHPSLTLEVKNDLEQFQFALCMLKELKLSGAVGKFLEMTASFTGKKGVTSTSTVTYTDEREFFNKMITFKYATNIAGLTAASAVPIQSFELSITKDTEELYALGDTQPFDIANKKFSIEGNIDVYLSNTDMEAIYKGGASKAIRIDVLHTDTIGATSHPQITIDLAKCFFESWEPSGGMNDIIKQTIKFKAKYSLTDSSIGTVTVVNTKASY